MMFMMRRVDADEIHYVSLPHLSMRVAGKARGFQTPLLLGEKLGSLPCVGFPK